MDAIEVKGWIEEGFRAIREEVGGLREELSAFRAEADTRFETMEQDVRARGIQYEEIRHLLTILKEGESVDLARRVVRLEKRVDRLERR